MSQQQLFELGSKFIGLYCMVMSVPNLVSGVLEIILPKATREPRLDSFTSLSSVIFTLSFLLLSGIGLFVFRRADVVRKFAFAGDDQVYDSKLEEPFAIGVKLFGAFLFLRTLPRFLRQLSQYIFIVNSSLDFPPVASPLMERLTNFLPDLVSLLFGLLLFFRGELLSCWAFATNKPSESIDS
ncbi:MAG: hypothetical protein EXR70_06635 [Deltaproteobacteria bacterium]|nr:hypothetical protein [Deltaproteobacteria bacterium]